MDFRDRPCRVLFLASYFPKPDNPLMGVWALLQAQAFLRQGMDVRVVSLTSWVPRIAGKFRPGARAYACCPPVHHWDDLHVEYPRWALYQVGPLKKWAHRDPELQLRIGWRTAQGALDRILDEFSPDVVYAHHTGANGYIAEKLRQRHGLPYVVTDHEFGEIRDCEVFPKRRRVFDRIARNASVMVSIASRMEADTKRIFPFARTCIVHNGINALPEKQREISRPPAIEGKLVVFSAGMFYERKGFPLLIQAFSKIAARYPEAILRIAGDGAERPQVERMIRECGLENRVQLLGLTPHDTILQEMAWSDVFALIGWDEPWGVVFAEAMEAGKPIVCANDGGINDVVQNGVHGYMVPPRDVDAAAEALGRLLSDREARSRMGQAAKDLVNSEFTWDANARAMKRIFSEVLAADSVTS